MEFRAPGNIVGAVWARSQKDRQWAVGLFQNYRLIDSQVADLEGENAGLPEGEFQNNGFRFTVNEAALRSSDLLEVRVLNTDHVVGELTKEEMSENSRDDTGVASEAFVGTVRHVIGLTLEGEMFDVLPDNSSYEVLALKNGRIVGRSQIDKWRHVGDPTDVLGAKAGFDLFLDPVLADGELHQIRVETSTGEVVQGSPVDIIAHPNAFRDACFDLLPNPRSHYADEAFDRLFENSIPFESYIEFFPELGDITRHRPTARRFGKFGVFDDQSHADYTLVYHQDVSLRTDASKMCDHLDGGICYFDLCLKSDGQLYPLLHPAFDFERFLEQGYASYAFAVHKTLLQGLRLDTFEGPFDLFLHLLDTRITTQDISHLPEPIGILDVQQPAEAATAMRQALVSRFHRKGHGTAEVHVSQSQVLPSVHVLRDTVDHNVSVIIPTRNFGDLLWDCVTTLRKRNPGFNFDITVVDNGSNDQKTLNIIDRLESGGARILEYQEGFNYSVINNLAAEHAAFDQLCFLNNDVRFDQDGVFKELCGRMSDPSIGAVGPLMSRASEVIQHGGVILGPWHGACHAFEDRMLGDAGYAELLLCAREVSAVTGALLLTRKSHFDELGGFDENRFPINFNDVDYCLRLREKGLRVVFTPHTHVQHLESVSRGTDVSGPSKKRMWRELENLRTRWRDVIMSDPFFHPLFSSDTLPYRALSSRRRQSSLRTSSICRSSDRPVGY